MGTLAGAEVVYISDYPAPEILANINLNIEKNIPPHLQAKVFAAGHEWGVLADNLAQTQKHSFTRVIAADCLWMPWQHFNLVASILHFLSFDRDAKAWITAGFHTGRAKLAPFFDVAAKQGLEVEDIWERDCDGHEREWVTERDDGREHIGERKKWLVVAVLRRPLVPSPVYQSTDT